MPPHVLDQRQATRPICLSSAFDLEQKTPLGVISNARAHRNQLAFSQPGLLPSHIMMRRPQTGAELNLVLAQFRHRSVRTIIIDGGDGTVRDVLSVAGRHYGDQMPRLIILPSGKTNALAHDLNVPMDFHLLNALAFFTRLRTVRRSPIEIAYRDLSHSNLVGFLFGAGAFVHATNLAQRFHRLGAFSGLAVGCALATAIMQSAFANNANIWRQGEEMCVRLPNESAEMERRYLFLASTLRHLPAGVKPFGTGEPGMRILNVAAPPRFLAIAAPVLLAGRYPPSIAAMGYQQAATDEVYLRLESNFILDGEAFPGGDLIIRQLPPLEFLVPD